MFPIHNNVEAHGSQEHRITSKWALSNFKEWFKSYNRANETGSYPQGAAEAIYDWSGLIH